MKKLIFMALAMVCAVASWAATRAEFAYALSANQTGDEVTFTFKVTGDVTDSRIILTSTSSFGSVEIPVGPVTAENGASVTHNMSTLAGDYTWSVEVTSAAIESTGVAYQQEATKRTTAYNGGVVIITDPEQDSFGYYVVGHSMQNGFDYFDPQGNITASKQHSEAFEKSTSSNNPAHGDQLRGKAVFSNWSDAHSGYYIIDPLNPATAPVQMLQGTRQESNGTGYTAGAFKNGSTIIGGGAACVAFQGSGENTVMYSFVEDMTGSGFGANKLMKYTIGTSDQITAAPTCLNPSSTLLGGGGDIIVYGDGFFATNNNNGDANKNTSTRPAFVYCNNTGTVLFNSSTLTDITSCGTGFAITADGSFAVVHDRANKKLLFYDVTWSSNTPSFTKSTLEITTPAADTWSHLRFDPAGNLYAYYNLSGFVIYGFANDAPKATTPAKAADTVSGTSATCDTRAMAYDLNMQKAGNNIAFTYYLSANAKNVTFVFTDAEHNTKTLDLGAKLAGSYQNEIDVSWFDGKDYLWSVEVTAYPSGSYRRFASIAFDKNYAGVIPVTDPNSPFFGYTLVALGANGGYKLYKPKPNDTPDPNNDPSFIISSSGNPDCFSSTTAGSPWRGTFFNGKFYVANDDAATSGIYFTDPSTLSVATQLFSGTRDEATGNFTFGGTTVSGRTSCVAFQGSGEETKLYTLDRISGNIVRYDIGEETSIKVAPTIISSKLSVNKDVDIITTENGFFASQRRSLGNQNTGYPAFIYCNNNGDILYNAGEHSDIIPSGTSIALNAQADRLAVCRFSDTKIDVFSVEWSAEGVPSLSKLGEIPCESTDWDHMRFDAAGNLHVYHKAKGYYIYSIAYPAAVTTTNYRLSVIYQGGVSGADDIEVAPATDDEPARIFNLQGIEMHGELAPGIYIRRTATKSEKFIVR